MPAVLYFRQSLNAAVKPPIASIAAMGNVFLPGMITGRIICGSNLVVAKKPDHYNDHDSCLNNGKHRFDDQSDHEIKL